jgi:hypothetical protein
MRITVEEAVAEDHRHPRLAHPVCESAAFFERVRVRADVGDLHPVDVLERQHALARVAPVHARNLDVWVARPVAAEAVGVAALRAVVELEPDRPRELVDEVARVDEVERADPLLGQTRSLIEEREVGLDLARCAGTLNLDGDLPAVGQRGAVDLADRRRGDRCGVEVEKRALEREIELGLDHLLDLLERERPHVVLEPAELHDDVGRHDVRSRREQLTELHERRAELVEHLAQVNAAGGGGLRLDRRAVPPGEQVVQLVRLEEVAEPVANRDLRYLGEASEVPLLRFCRHGPQSCTMPAETS